MAHPHFRRAKTGPDFPGLRNPASRSLPRPLPSASLLQALSKPSTSYPQSYPCRSLESAIKLAERFIAGVIKPRPAAPQPEATPAPAAEPVAA